MENEPESDAPLSVSTADTAKMPTTGQGLQKKPQQYLKNDLAHRAASGALLGVVWTYQHLISPLKPASCRFVPTCSAYAAEAIRRHGPWRGARLAAGRLARCHPWGGSGFDPVPP